MFMKLIWLIPLMPFLGSFINGIVGRKKFSKSTVSAVANGTVLISFILMILAVYQLAGLPVEARNVNIKLFDWINVGHAHLSNGLLGVLNIAWEFKLDPLSAVMGLVVTGVGFVIHIYSIGYMWDDEYGYARYFSYLNLFMGSMLMLVLGGNYLLMFIGWEGVGLCSYLLIGYYFDKKFCADAGKKAFITNRIGDLGFVIGLLFIFVAFGSLNFDQVASRIAEVYQAGFNFAGWHLSGVTLFNVIGVALFVGATGKSAQIPLYVWLPDAMAGPTPVSALIHAATMVTSGLYMIARTSGIYSGAPVALMVVGLIGAATAFFAATIGMAQNDIKKVLAYSTVSQLGYMFMGMAAAAYWAGIFHVMTHAFFKGCLFLGSGSIIHAMHHAYHKTHNHDKDPQDMRNMGGLRRIMPRTYWTFLAATLAISGIPLFSGFFSKDEILWKTAEQAIVYGHKIYWLYWALGAVAAGITAFYMFRLVFLTFFGEFKGTDEEKKALHESPGTMTWPLIILGTLSVIGGYLGFPHLLGKYLGHIPNVLEKWLEPAMIHPHLTHAVQHASEGVEFLFMFISIAIAVAGIFVAWLFYMKKPELPAKFTAMFHGAWETVYHKYYVDEVYDAVFITGMKNFGYLLWAFDVWVLDGIVNGARNFTIIISEASRLYDEWIVDGLVNIVGKTVEGIGYMFRKIQTGYVQTYAFMMVAGFILLISYYIFR